MVSLGVFTSSLSSRPSVVLPSPELPPKRVSAGALTVPIAKRKVALGCISPPSFDSAHAHAHAHGHGHAHAHAHAQPLDPFSDLVRYPSDEDVKTDESLWRMYERWASSHGKQIEKERFPYFKENALFVHFENKIGCHGDYALNDICDFTPQEVANMFMKPRGYSPELAEDLWNKSRAFYAQRRLNKKA